MLDDRNLHYDLFALALLAFTIFLALSLATHSPSDPLSEAVFPLNRIYAPNQIAYPLNAEVQNACGIAGATSADILFRIFGLMAYFVVGCLAIADVWMLMRKPIEGAGTRLIGWLIALVGATTFLQMFVTDVPIGSIIGPGGYLGAMGRTFLESHFATAGSLILLASLVVGGVLLCTDYMLLHFGLFAGTALLNMMPRTQFNLLGRLSSIWNRKHYSAASLDAYEEEEDDYEYEEEFEDEQEGEVEPSFVKRAEGRMISDLAAPSDISEENVAPDADAIAENELSAAADEQDNDFVYEYDFVEEYEDEDELAQPAEDTAIQSEPEESAPAKPLSAKAKKEADRQEVIAQLEEASREYDPQDYELPPIKLLNQVEGYDVAELTKEVKRKASMLEKTFEDFNLEVKVVDIETGPVIAQYEVALKRGLRLSKITGLADDLAIALRVPSVRIVAPIPGKNTVGIEVPNDDRQIVRLREVMNETNGRTRKMAIPIYLGKDVSGNPLAVDLAKLPHLLIAGRTGTGKSVCLNAIITSILMSKTPDDVRMLMIDPKMVELSGYARLPHLMHPVVTDMRKAEAILAWACEKMDERYQLLARAGVRHITSYNQLGEEELMERLQPETEDEKKLIPRHLPFIVIVADEMADLMMTAGKEVEAHIIRLAAKSRAIGIHLILATQKPTVDVITGLIKSNLPARIAFQVASKTDSRVVLDENGADKLLGYGDMLFLSPGTSTLLRGQGTFLSDDEIDRVVDYCGSRGEQNFVRELVQLKIEDKEEGEAVELKKRDDLYEQAVEVVVREGRGSVSLLQRNLQIGYGRAARLIDFMAEDGIVGSYNGSQAREVLMTLADWEATKASNGDSNTATASPEEPTLPPEVEPVTPAPKIVAIPPLNQQWKEDDVEDEEEVVLEGEYEVADEEDDYDEEVDELDDEVADSEEEEDSEEAELDEDDEFEDELEDEEDDADELEDELEEHELEEGELDEAEYEYEYEDVDDEIVAAVEEDEEAEKAAADEDGFEGEEFEQEDFDDKAFQEAVAKETGFDASEYQDVEDLEDQVEDAKTIAAIKKTKSRKRRRGPKHDEADRLSPSKSGKRKNKNSTIRIHRSHK